MRSLSHNTFILRSHEARRRHALLSLIVTVGVIGVVLATTRPAHAYVTPEEMLLEEPQQLDSGSMHGAAGSNGKTRLSSERDTSRYSAPESWLRANGYLTDEAEEPEEEVVEPEVDDTEESEDDAFTIRVDAATLRLLDRIANLQGGRNTASAMHSGAPLLETYNPSPLAPTGLASGAAVAVVMAAVGYTLWRARKMQ